VEQEEKELNERELAFLLEMVDSPVPWEGGRARKGPPIVTEGCMDTLQAGLDGSGSWMNDGTFSPLYVAGGMGGREEGEGLVAGAHEAGCRGRGEGRGEGGEGGAGGGEEGKGHGARDHPVCRSPTPPPGVAGGALHLLLNPPPPSPPSTAVTTTTTTSTATSTTEINMLGASAL